jgi:hypothetical protein
MRVVHAVLHLLGAVCGLLLLPLTIFFVIRHRTRAFHPDGTVYAGRFEPLCPAGEPLAGPLIARLAATFIRGVDAEKPDVIGLAVRFGGSEDTPKPPRAQDLLSATFDGFAPRQLAAGKAGTNVHDLLDNDYRAIARYHVPTLGIVHLRWSGLRRRAAPGGSGTRAARLAEAIAADEARFVLEASQGVDAWLSLGILHLTSRVEISQKSLAFSPFRGGRGLRATGFLNGLRRPNYVVSQFLRGAWMR